MLPEEYVAELHRQASNATTTADYLRVARRVAESRDLPGLLSLRLAVLSTSSLQFLEPFLAVEGLRQGVHLHCYFGPFGQFEQELATPNAPLYQHQPDLLVLAMQPEDLDPDAVVRFHATNGARFAALCQEVRDRLATCIQSFRSHRAAAVLVANNPVPCLRPLGLFDANVVPSLTHAVAEANLALARTTANEPGAYVWDYAGVVTEVGTGRFSDRRMVALGRIPVAASHQPTVAAHLVRTMLGTLRPSAKCLVLDLDNTLWGGVVGDDGIDGIQLGDDYPGNVYKAFQRRLLALSDRGILLAIASKNEREIVDQVFREHPDMLIRWDDIAAARINWQDKSQNIRELAMELNLGVDALVFFDDNPVERAEVRVNAPEVNVMDVPNDPLAFEDTLAAAGFFDQATLSAEDRQRTVMYRHEVQRRQLSARATTLDEFLESMDMRATVGHAGPTTLNRIAQLVGKTNQFNLTTRRHSQAELAAKSEDGSHVVAWLRLHDCFGDQGLVAVGILAQEGSSARIDTLVMSCRVMNRRVEQALLAYLAEEASRLDCATLVGEYRPTKKNAVVKDLYDTLGFTETEPPVEGGRRFELDLTTSMCPWPELIHRDDDSF